MFSDLRECALNYALLYTGNKERPPKSNRGIMIDRMQKVFGLIGQQYCVMFCIFCYWEAAKRLASREPQVPKFPLPMTASSQTLYEDALKKGFTYTDPKLIKPGDIVIWRKFKLWQGHAGLIFSELKPDNTFLTIEGNTSNSDFGDQRDGDGIYKRVRKANKINFTISSFYIRGFIDVEKYFN